jgi:hypothetical protein
VLDVGGVEDLAGAYDALAEGADDVFAALGEGEVGLAGLWEGGGRAEREKARKREEKEEKGKKRKTNGQKRSGRAPGMRATHVLTAETPLRFAMPNHPYFWHDF